MHFLILWFVRASKENNLGGVLVRSSIKKQLVELVEYVDFPMVVYVYETGKVIAANRLAKDALGGSACQNVNLLWPDQKKYKFSDEILSGQSQLFFEQEILIGDEVHLIDFEVNVMPLPGEHIIIGFFERSYKQAFRMDQAMRLPAVLWMNPERQGITISTVLQLGMERYQYLSEHREEADDKEQAMLAEVDRQFKQVVEERQPIFCQMEQIDFNRDNSGMTKVNKLPILGKKEELLGVLMVFETIISDKEYARLFQEARYENAMLRECLVEQKKIAIGVCYNEDMLLRYATANFKELGYSMEDVAMRKIKWMDVICEEDRERVMDEIDTAIQQRERFFQQKYRILDAGGREIWIDAFCTGKDFSESGEIMHIVFQLDRENKGADMQTKVVMRYETYMDYLTGLPNRLRYEIDASKLIEAAITSKKKGYVIVLDLDDFRHINEGLGPEYGDELLRQLSKLLNDITEVENYCYRVDGDEFLLFIRGEYTKQVEDIIQRCLSMFHNSWQLKDKECYCSVSIGIAEYPKDSADPRELLKQADAAVYEAKRKGKNRIQHYKKAVLKTSQDRVNYEKYLRKAIAKGCVEFEMHFQPVVDTQTKELVSAEALVRWYSPELGFITPVNFISLSEYLGLIVPLGEYVLQQSFQTCKYWNDTYNPDFCVSVNLSVIQLVQSNIVERIMEIARTTGVNPRNIILEVTESLAVEDMNLMKKVLFNLKEYGFSIALDDFGTGYSSLNHIMEMPLDYVKIDKSFVANYGTENFNPSLLSAITELAHSVNMKVVVEGVETKQQMEFLMFLDADRIQGYLYGKPMPVKDFEKEFMEK